MPTTKPITISSPILQGGEYFKIRYRDYPNGSFVNGANQTNSPFTITVPNAGEFEIEIIRVLSGGTECPAIFIRTIVAQDYDCNVWDFTPNVTQDVGGQYYVMLNYGTGAQPPCGWSVIFQGNTTKFSTLPLSPLRIPYNNTTQRLIVQADFCNGNTVDCLNTVIQRVTPPEPPICIPVVILGGEILMTDTPIGFEYAFVVTFTQSTPQTPFADFIWKQIGTPRPGFILDTGSFKQINPGFPYVSTGGNNRLFSKVVSPKPTVSGTIQYEIRMRDACNVWHTVIATL